MTDPRPEARSTPPSLPGIDDVLSVWIDGIGRDGWFVKDPAIDARVRAQLGPACHQALAGALDSWQSTPEGALALCILLDQVPRNLFRGDARAFAGDSRALAVARGAIDKGFDLAVPEDVRLFFYLPFEHSEDLAAQQQCLRLFQDRTGNADWVRYAQRHLQLIERFGRFPHRNAALGRDCTAEEEAYLAEHGVEF